MSACDIYWTLFGTKIKKICREFLQTIEVLKKCSYTHEREAALKTQDGELALRESKLAFLGSI
jgi:hypothetical protein